MRPDRRRIAAGLAALSFALGGAPACAQDVGGFFKNMFTPSPPPASGALPLDEIPCPQVDVSEGGAAITAFAGGRVGEQGAMRNQISLVNFARECRPRPDGSVVVKVGVQGRALLGPGGSPGTFATSVHFAVKVGDRMIMDRVQRVSVTVPAGETQGSFTVVQDGLMVPAKDATEFEIEVGLGAGARAAPRKRPKAQG